ncbi:hypothetical protein ACFL43_03810 [Thermodesulfobacteriota bacterium]
MNKLSKKENNLLQSMHVSAKAEDEIKKVWQAGEYKYQREYTNVLLLLMPMFIIVFLAGGTGYPELTAMKHVFGWAAWFLYFAIPTFIILSICFRTLASHDRSILLGHSSVYLWRRPKLIKTIYSTVISLLLIFILAKAGLIITSLCLAATFTIIALCTITIRKKVQSVLDEIEQGDTAPGCLPVPEAMMP